jgi:fructose-1,6-bisphosphatase I
MEKRFMEEIFRLIEKIAIKIDLAIKEGESGYSDLINETGDIQLKLDILSDKIIEDELSSCKEIQSIISEEKEGELQLNEGGEFKVCYDPLDGSSIVDYNLSVGSIFGIYRGGLDGDSIEASVYVVYGPRLEIVKTIKGSRPKLYRYIDGSFIEQSEITLNSKGKINAPGGTQKNWLPHHKALIEKLFQSGYRLRYSGGMVPDLHQVLLKGGGLFSYPATTDKAKGKLRALFEVIPFALTFIEAGGGAIDDKGESLLNFKPSFLHDTTPCFFGSKEEIKLVKEAYSGE